jgi:hypothetical protein
MPKEVRARSAARINRLLVVPAAAGLLLWMKSVAAAGLCVLGVVAAVHAVPALTHWVAAGAGPAPASSTTIRHGAAPFGQVAAPVPTPDAPSESPSVPSAAASEPHAPPVAAPPPAIRNRPPLGVTEAPRAEPAPADSLAREAAMLEEARAVLNRDPRAALAIADRHAATFPAGSLGIERELLAVQALQRLGRVADARTRGLGLLEQARGSIYEKRAKALLETISSP